MTGKMIIGGIVWVTTVSIGAWAYVEGKRADNGLTRVNESKKESQEKDQEELGEETSEEELGEELRTPPLGQIPWVAVTDRGQFRKRNPDTIRDDEWAVSDIEDIQIEEAKSPRSEPFVF